MKKILITGGAGFIGSHIADHYLEQGWEVMIYDNFSTGRRDFCHADVQICEGDICDVEGVQSCIKSFQPNVISHHAAHVSVRNSFDNPTFDAEKNILGSINIFRLAGKYQVEQVVFASTGGVMLEKTHAEFPAPVQRGNLDLDSPYSLSKFCAEKYLRYFAKEHNYTGTILRYANVYGPRQTPKAEAGVIAIFLQHLLDGKTPKIYGDGNQTRDFIYIGDVVSGHAGAVEKKLSGTYNLSSATEISVNQIYEALTQKLDISLPANKEDFPFEELARSCLDNAELVRDGDWEPKWDFDKGLEKTIAWNRQFYK